MKSQMDIMFSKITNLQSEINSLTAQIKGGSTTAKITKDQLSDELQEKIDNPVSNGSLTLSAFSSSDRASLEAAINSDASVVSVQVSKLQSLLNTPRSKRSVLYSNIDTSTDSESGAPSWADVMNGTYFVTTNKNFYDKVKSGIDSYNSGIDDGLSEEELSKKAVVRYRYRRRRYWTVDIDDMDGAIYLDS